VRGDLARLLHVDEHRVVRSRQSRVVEDAPHHSGEGARLARTRAGVRDDESDGSLGREHRQVADREPVHDHDLEDLPMLAGEVVRHLGGGAAGEDECAGAREQEEA
jgi:hypothetical protein